MKRKPTTLMNLMKRGIKKIKRQFDLQEARMDKIQSEYKLIAYENIGLRLQLKRINNEKIRVVFVCHRPSLWESLHSVYDALKADERFEVLIVAIPSKDKKSGVMMEHEDYTCEGAEEFWKGYGCINGYDYEKKEWLDLRELKPDYVFFQQPYNIIQSIKVLMYLYLPGFCIYLMDLRLSVKVLWSLRILGTLCRMSIAISVRKLMLMTR